ncbi:hypothetical protein NQ318_017153 [Aromia moschata]|uniref:Uncharacterized protein n=1 Tax=Aromia moschata TaxID=1265417 RepID=A0AAV8YR49_9CUCU|nr:hypothetical protein NQ318_017153 [Aromia moschata]
MNSVDFLLTNNDITYDIRTEIKRLGRPIPDLIISKTDVGKSRNYSRNFNSSVYDRFKWLCGCPKRNKLFCFIWLVMVGNRSAWTQEGGGVNGAAYRASRRPLPLTAASLSAHKFNGTHRHCGVGSDREFLRRGVANAAPTAKNDAVSDNKRSAIAKKLGRHRGRGERAAAPTYYLYGTLQS